MFLIQLTEVDTIKRFGGSTSPNMPWPEEEEDGDEDTASLQPKRGRASRRVGSKSRAAHAARSPCSPRCTEQHEEACYLVIFLQNKRTVLFLTISEYHISISTQCPQCATSGHPKGSDAVGWCFDPHSDGPCARGTAPCRAKPGTGLQDRFDRLEKLR